MNGKELVKPCPFCGGEAKAWEASLLTSTEYLWSIGCTEFGCGITMGDFTSEKQAIKAWNRRAK